MDKIKFIFFAIVFLFSLSYIQILNAQSNKKKSIKTESLDDLEKRIRYLKKMDGTKTLERALEVAEDPCTIYDDSLWYTAFNQKEGRKGDPELANSLLKNCQQQLRTKIRSRYRNITYYYFDQMDTDAQSTVSSHIQGAGQNIIEQILDDTQEYCRKTSAVQDDGNIIMYMSIRVNKKKLVNTLITELSKNKHEGILFDENRFKESAFKIFIEN